MNVFDEAYSSYYNLLYQDKNYEQEADYVSNLIKQYAPTTQNILEVGCGTGKHAYLFSQKGFEVTGLEVSNYMLAIAKEKYGSIDNLRFAQGDFREFNLNTQFDVITSLFHVISYQTTNEDVELCLQNAYRHLEKGGLFIFDVWYGAAVLTEKPSTRIKRVENQSERLIRLAESEIKYNQNIVEINYEIILQDKVTQDLNLFREQHLMRYFFLPEIQYFAEKHNFNIVLTQEWLTGKPIGANTWGIVFLLQK